MAVAEAAGCMSTCTGSEVRKARSDLRSKTSSESWCDVLDMPDVLGKRAATMLVVFETAWLPWLPWLLLPREALCCEWHSGVGRHCNWCE